MIEKLIRVTVLVRDQDEALRFYTEKLGLETRADATFGPGMRWLTVAPRGQAELEIVLQQPNPAMHGEENARQMLELVGRGTTWVFACDDCRATYAELRGRGVEFHSEPQEQPYGIEAVFVDLYGNSFSLLQPREMPTPPMSGEARSGEARSGAVSAGEPGAGEADWEARRTELLGAMRAGSAAMAAAIGGLDEARLTEPGATGRWSVKDVLAHVAAGNDWLSGEVERATRGEAPPPAAEIQKMQDEGWFDTETINTMTYGEHKDRPLEDVRDWWRRSTERLQTAVAGAPVSVLAAPDWWTGGRPLGRCIWVDHEGKHAEQVRAWVAEQQR